MHAMPQSWTDKPLDDFRHEVGQRFDRVEAEIRALRVETKAGFERMDERFERMHRLMLQLGGGILVALLGVIASQL
jgi:hypothetical protein